MTRLLIIKTGSTFPEIADRHGDFDALFKHVMARDGVDIRVCDVQKGDKLPSQAEADAVVITGSPAMVTDREAWSEATAAWLADWVEGGGPTLGVCYGHQLLAQALGGTVANHRHGREMGTLEVTLTGAATDDPLFASFPRQFPAHLTHRQSVAMLPPGAQLLAYSDLEPHQAFRVGTCAWGVQFHPEFDEAVMAAYIERQASTLASEGRDPKAMTAALQPTDQAREVLSRFIQLAMR